jgi:hypothetical protein
LRNIFKLNKMKKLLTIALLLMPVFMQAQSNEEILSSFIQQKVESQSVFIHVNIAEPIGMSIIDLYTSNYYIQYIKGKVNCDLPYYGNVGSGVVNDRDLSIRANNTPAECTTVFNPKKKLWKINIAFIRDKDSEKTECQIQLYSNGLAYLRIQAPGRSTISFEGSIVL